MTILYYDDFLGWPKEWTTRYYNGSNEPCDLLIGPCACGAWHGPDDWADVLRYYNAKLQHRPKPAPQPLLTLSYF